MGNLKKSIITGLKGYAMGAANVIPGVSGGTIALLTGIFSEIIEALNSLMDISVWKLLLKGDLKGFWERIHGTFIVALLVGVLLSIFSLANLMVYVMAYYPVQTWAFFFGLIIASAVYMIADIKGWKPVDCCSSPSESLSESLSAPSPLPALPMTSGSSSSAAP